ncbi:MAG: glycoside hydrolase family 65 protein, partial [Bacteroidales bacterium]
VTQDKAWLENTGWPLLQATADFWVSRSEKDDAGKYHINNVVAADEWAENVDDNAFTNGAARVNLEAAIKSARILNKPVPKQWSEVADNLQILSFEDGVTREHASYKGENIKQADVNLLAYPLEIITDAKQIAKDLSYYEVRVPEKDTPAMTQAIFALLYSRLGNAEKADHFFRDAYIPNLNPPFRVIAETKGGTNPYFVTGAGGVLQTVMMGFAGLRITDKGIVQDAAGVLPSHWKSVTLRGIGPKGETYTRKK